MPVDILPAAIAAANRRKEELARADNTYPEYHDAYKAGKTGASSEGGQIEV